MTLRRAPDRGTKVALVPPHLLAVQRAAAQRAPQRLPKQTPLLRRLTTVITSVALRLGNAATAPAVAGPARRLVSSAAATISVATTQVTAVTGQPRAEPARGRLSGITRGASASAASAAASASAGGSPASPRETAT